MEPYPDVSDEQRDDGLGCVAAIVGCLLAWAAVLWWLVL